MAPARPTSNTGLFKAFGIHAIVIFRCCGVGVRDWIVGCPGALWQATNTIRKTIIKRNFYIDSPVFASSNQAASPGGSLNRS